jgi:MinD superfamily P-loop ATPase
MKQIALLGGASVLPRVAAALAHWAARQGEVVLIDADVEARGLAHLLGGELQQAGLAVAATEADVDPELCTACGRCAQVCRFGAVAVDADDAPARILRWACCGCGACVAACPEGAIALIPAPLGRWHRQDTPLGPLFSASLEPGCEHLGEAVTAIRQRATREAVEGCADWILIAGPIGSGRAAIAAYAGADLLLAVVEPGPLGKRRLEHALALAERIGAPLAVVIAGADADERDVARMGIELDVLLGQVTVDPAPQPASTPEARALDQDPLVSALAPIWEACRARLQGAPAADEH